MTVANIFRDISKAVSYFFKHKEKVRIFLLSYAVKVLGGCDLGAVSAAATQVDGSDAIFKCKAKALHFFCP